MSDKNSEAGGLFTAVGSELNFPREEARVLAFWKERGIFEKTLCAETRATGPSQGSFVFYEGPPTANGMPHNGHVLTRAMKDVLPRYKTMCGYDVPRKAGWDTHGLPVEVEVEKALDIHGKADIEAYGIRPFITKCMESVFRYTDAWERNTEQIGFWVDLSSAYVTFHRSYVESVWWALSKLHQKGLLYRGQRVCWWWPQGGTALSAAEVGWNYKTIDDPALYVALPLVELPADAPAVLAGAALCVWTTTPWTLPSNGYAAVKAAVDYVVVDGGERGKLIVAAALRQELAGKLKAELPVLATLKGQKLEGLRYRPPFDTFAKDLFDRRMALKDGGEVAAYWRVLAADFVTLDTGTGAVHIAPAFGEDDHLAHRAELSRYQDPDSLPLICSVTPQGTLTDNLGELAGMWVKDADPLLTAELRQSGRLIHSELYRHDYPFCWRADDDPLIQLARPAWYIRTTERIADAIANNREVNWLPEHIKSGRFGDFLDHNVDWALSRERFWGTPLNVWICDQDGTELAPSGVAEIEAHNPAAFAHFHAARKQDPSLNEHLIVHKPWIDEVILPCPKCGGDMHRVTEVIDAWFDSGSMPFAQLGFPHVEGSVEQFARSWPADFISEAIDQTRGWFYSLLMISTLLFDEATVAELGLPKTSFPHPYKTCVVLGHVCDKEGKKESKQKGNYTPPDVILDKVRMEFAALSGSGPALGKVRGKLKLAPGVAFIARQDYEGLDLGGQSAQVVLYRADRAEAPRALELRPTKALPRRVVALDESDLQALGLEECREGLGVSPQDVPRLPQPERVYLEDPSRPAPGADAFRWFFYAASPPWNNTRHSLSNVRLLQKDFMIKLRNVYSFFTIYASIDGFSPARGNEAACDTEPATIARGAGWRPLSERSELDRWLSSELGLAIRDVRRSLDTFHIYDAAQRIVDLVDGLSNWYVRRSRARFWASVDDSSLRQDKQDAYFTLYEVLVSLCKLIAPFVPFFAETIYQNLVRRPWPDTQPESVHLCRYPDAAGLTVDAELAGEMRLVRQLVSLGLQVRTDNKLKVRQPLSRADIVLSSAEVTAERMRRHVALVAEELNVHEVRWLRPGEEGQAVRYELKPNFRLLGPRLGKQVQQVKQQLAKADASELRALLATAGKITVEVGGATIELSEEEVQVAVVAAEGFAAAGGKPGVVVLHTTLDQQLLDEGLAREVLARVQALRKKRALEYTQTIALTVRGSERICRVVQADRAHIVKEALCSGIEIIKVAADELAEPEIIQDEHLEIEIA